ncbi:hypothetical protein AVEN_149173-1 [Araneus ventricosus]|uniref:Uncharacterized protein n=1 Tax=Araneus ventricosus TaxID=182803 RepID=A0A4Y2TEK0_ARAVE|nr:hypothetical protein AVEN_149173-1 [Araneus ventricosus]
MSLSKDATFQCDAFINFMKAYKRNLKKKNGPRNFDSLIPYYLKNFVMTLCIHESSKDVEFINMPIDMILVNMIQDPSKYLGILKKLIQVYTNGFINDLDEGTKESCMDPEFRFLILGIFYMDASWDGENDIDRRFNNQNGTNKEVPFFKLCGREVTIIGKVVYVCVPFKINNLQEEGNYVRFSMPIDKWNKKFKADIFLPKLTLEDRQELSDEDGKIVINFKYRQDEKGFEAACVYASDCVDGEIEKPKEIIFNNPFKIEIFSQDFKVYEINVHNL